MSYSAFETSPELGQPVEVYRFTAGAQSWFYTSAESEVTLSATLYLPETIARGVITDGPEERGANFELTVPGTNPIARMFILTVPGVRVRVEVLRFHRNDTPTPEVIRIFDGYVMSVSFQENMKVAKMACRPAIAVLGRTIPRFTFQAQCNHVLYDTGCGVDSTDPAFRASGKSVTGSDGNELMVAGLGSFVDGWFDGGFVEVIGSGDVRLVLSHVGGTLTLLLPFATTPDTVNVYAGCEHIIQVCGSKFANVPRFGGHAFVPPKNPFQTGID